MSWNIEYRYACLELQEVKTQKDLNDLLFEFASVIWSQYQQAELYPDCLDQFLWDLENEEPKSDQEITQGIANIAALYLDQVEFSNSGATLLVRTEYDSDYDDRDFADRLASFLFETSHVPFFQICQAAFDKGGGYSYQWIGHRKEGKVVIENTTDFLEQFFQQALSPVVA